MLTGDGTNLSQGQRQLLAIARAAVADPPVLILDEATSSIDTRTEKLVQDGMDGLMYGSTTYVIDHRSATVRNSDCIMVLEQEGRIIERGTHDELIAQKGRAGTIVCTPATLRKTRKETVKILLNQSNLPGWLAPSRIFLCKCRNSDEKLTNWKKVAIIDSVATYIWRGTLCGPRDRAHRSGRLNVLGGIDMAPKKKVSLTVLTDGKFYTISASQRQGRGSG